MAKGISGYRVSFESVKNKTIGEVFGTEVIPATEIMKKMWTLIKTNNLKVNAPTKGTTNPETDTTETTNP
jgi:hypothetical protein